MSETLRLLKYDPAVALLIMANNHFNIRLYPQYTSVSAPVAVAGSDTLTDVVISTHDTTDAGIRRRYRGSMRYRYHRLSVDAVFGAMVLDLTPPLTVLGVMTNIAQASGLAVTDDDFENALITTNRFELVAKANSLRWVGQTTVMLNEPGVHLPLAEAFPNNILDGLHAPNFGTDIPISTVLNHRSLMGLTYKPPGL